MTVEVDDDDTYFLETVHLMREGTALAKLRAAVASAEELERRGVAWSDAWRNTDTWHLLWRVWALIAPVSEEASRTMHRDSDEWRQRHNRKKNIRAVK